MRSRITITLISVLVLVGGCAQYSEQAVAVKLQHGELIKTGQAHAIGLIDAKVADYDADWVFDADSAVIKDVLTKVHDTDTTHTTEAIVDSYFAKLKEERAKVEKERTDWRIIKEELLAVESGLGTQNDFNRAELIAARKNNILAKKEEQK